MFSTKQGAARLLLIVAVGLIFLKAIVSWITGSVAILAQAADSLLDVFAAIVTYSAVRVAEKPADRTHPYGYGKAEALGGLAQSLLLLGAGAAIIYSAVLRIAAGSPIEDPEAGIGVMLFSMAVSFLLSRYLLRVAQRTDSLALEANARNIAGDVYSALAVLVGLLLVRLTGLNYIDAVMAILVSGYVLYSGYRAMRDSLAELLDTRLPAEHEAIIRKVLQEHCNEIYGFHKLRTRHVGAKHHVDVHVLMSPGISLEKAHEVTQEIEDEIEKEMPVASVIIHAEPCDGECGKCRAVCEAKREPVRR